MNNEIDKQKYENMKQKRKKEERENKYTVNFFSLAEYLIESLTGFADPLTSNLHLLSVRPNPSVSAS